MYLSHLSLHDFRNFSQLSLTLGRGLYLFHGENAQGKTNLLEAVAMLATSNSFHATSDREVVNWDAPDHIARVNARVERSEDEVKIEIVIIDPLPASSNGTSPAIPQANGQRKRIKINGVPKKAADLVGQVTVVLFAPADLRLVDGAPEDRRRFLDRALCQVRPQYCIALQKYRKVVTQRSALLKRIRENQEDPRMLDYLDDRLTEWANIIVFERQRMVQALNQHVDRLQDTISGGRERLPIARPSISTPTGTRSKPSKASACNSKRRAAKKSTRVSACSATTETTWNSWSTTSTCSPTAREASSAQPPSPPNWPNSPTCATAPARNLCCSSTTSSANSTSPGAATSCAWFSNTSKC